MYWIATSAVPLRNDGVLWIAASALPLRNDFPVTARHEVAWQSSAFHKRQSMGRLQLFGNLLDCHVAMLLAMTGGLWLATSRHAALAAKGAPRNDGIFNFQSLRIVSFQLFQLPAVCELGRRAIRRFRFAIGFCATLYSQNAPG